MAFSGMIFIKIKPEYAWLEFSSYYKICFSADNNFGGIKPYMKGA